MAQLDLTLPEAPRKRSPGVLTLLILVINLVCLALVFVLVVRGRSGGEVADDATTLSSAERLRLLGRELERRTLYDAAAGVWAEYLEAADLDSETAAETVYRRGVCLQKAGRASEAARCFTAVTQKEGEGLALPRKQRREAHRHLLECLSALGKEEARQEALRAFSIPDAEEKGTVIARIGGEDVTLEDLRHGAIEAMRAQHAAFGGGGDPAETEAMIESLASQQLGDRKTLERLLQQEVSQRVLYREGLARGYASGAKWEDAAARFRRAWVGSRVVDDQARAAVEAIGDTDLRNHYDAHHDTYTEAASTEFAYLKLDDEAAATAAIATLAAGGDAAAELAKGFTAGGRAEVTGPLPDLGTSAEASAQLVALEEGASAPRPVQIGESWYVLRADRKHAERLRSFEEVQTTVRADLVREKREEAMRRLQESLTQKFRVEVIGDALDAATAPKDEPSDAEPSDASAAPSTTDGDATDGATDGDRAKEDDAS